MNKSVVSNRYHMAIYKFWTLLVTHQQTNECHPTAKDITIIIKEEFRQRNTKKGKKIRSSIRTCIHIISRSHSQSEEKIMNAFDQSS